MICHLGYANGFHSEIQVTFFNQVNLKISYPRMDTKLHRLITVERIESEKDECFADISSVPGLNATSTKIEKKIFQKQKSTTQT